MENAISLLIDCLVNSHFQVNHLKVILVDVSVAHFTTTNNEHIRFKTKWIAITCS